MPGLSALLTCTKTVDVFEPPQRERIRERAVALAAQGLTHREIAEQLPVKPTSTAVGHALALDRKMRAMGLEKPYVVILEPPPDYPKLRRHKNPKYRFEPVEGYVRPPLDE